MKQLPGQLLFALEVAVQGAFGQARGRGDIPHRGLGDALGHEQLQGGAGDQFFGMVTVAGHREIINVSVHSFNKTFALGLSSIFNLKPQMNADQADVLGYL